MTKSIEVFDEWARKEIEKRVQLPAIYPPVLVDDDITPLRVFSYEPKANHRTHIRVPLLEEKDYENYVKTITLDKKTHRSIFLGIPVAEIAVGVQGSLQAELEITQTKVATGEMQDILPTLIKLSLGDSVSWGKFFSQMRYEGRNGMSIGRTFGVWTEVISGQVINISLLRKRTIDAGMVMSMRPASANMAVASSKASQTRVKRAGIVAAKSKLFRIEAQESAKLSKQIRRWKKTGYNAFREIEEWKVSEFIDSEIPQGACVYQHWYQFKIGEHGALEIRRENLSAENQKRLDKIAGRNQYDAEVQTTNTKRSQLWFWQGLSVVLLVVLLMVLPGYFKGLHSIEGPGPVEVLGSILWQPFTKEAAKEFFFCDAIELSTFPKSDRFKIASFLAIRPGRNIQSMEALLLLIFVLAFPSLILLWRISGLKLAPSQDKELVRDFLLHLYEGEVLGDPLLAPFLNWSHYEVSSETGALEFREEKKATATGADVIKLVEKYGSQTPHVQNKDANYMARELNEEDSSTIATRPTSDETSPTPSSPPVISEGADERKDGPPIPE